VDDIDTEFVVVAIVGVAVIVMAMISEKVDSHSDYCYSDNTGGITECRVSCKRL
jgi:hypothetical protein